MNNTNTKIDLATYTALVKMIAAGFFDDDLNYIPHLGKLNAMWLFYNFCVKEDIDNIPHDTGDLDEVMLLVRNEHLLNLFNEAIKIKQIEFDFANAYKDAITSAKFDAAHRRETEIVKKIKDAFGI